MKLLPASLSRATNLPEFSANPIHFLAQARAELGDIFVLREQGPLFSRRSDCTGVIAVFGSKLTQAVLTDSNVYGLPISAAEHLELSQSLINLNRGLHSMRGKQHDDQQRLLMHVFNNRTIESMQGMITAGLERFVLSWRYRNQISLLEEMRRLTLELSTSLLFDQRYSESGGVAALAQKYFHLRRNATSATASPSQSTKTDLIAIGLSLDNAMRKYIKWCRSSGSSEGLIAKVACLQTGAAHAFSEDEVVAHGNVMFMSTNEPVAVSLVWTLLILSQRPELRRSLRDEVEGSTMTAGQSSLSLLNSVVSESLRLFTPNALMSRITTCDTLLNEIPLPERCEIVLCPFLAHRDPKIFSQPTEFLPSRWHSIKPSPFEYYPFGAGGHTCIGRSLALKLITATLASLMQQYEVVLSYDQEIDWQIDIMFMPANDPIMTLYEPRITDVEAGCLLGPITELFQL